MSTPPINIPGFSPAHRRVQPFYRGRIRDRKREAFRQWSFGIDPWTEPFMRVFNDIWRQPIPCLDTKGRKYRIKVYDLHVLFLPPPPDEYDDFHPPLKYLDYDDFPQEIEVYAVNSTTPLRLGDLLEELNLLLASYAKKDKLKARYYSINRLENYILTGIYQTPDGAYGLFVDDLR